MIDGVNMLVVHLESLVVSLAGKQGLVVLRPWSEPEHLLSWSLTLIMVDSLMMMVTTMLLFVASRIICSDAAVTAAKLHF